MNTLNKTITASLLKDAASYETMIARWSGLVNDAEARESLTAADHLLYLVLRGKDWRKGFSPITNANKIAGGHKVGFGQAWVRAISQVRNGYKGYFSDLLSAEAACLLPKLLPSVSTYSENELPDVAYNAQAAAAYLAEKEQG